MQKEQREHYTYIEPPREELDEQRERGKGFSCRFSILVPLYETKETYLREMVDSVLSQTYGNFELILADASASDRVEQVVKTYEDKRIFYRRLKRNCGISGNTKSGAHVCHRGLCGAFRP